MKRRRRKNRPLLLLGVRVPAPGQVGEEPERRGESPVLLENAPHHARELPDLDVLEAQLPPQSFPIGFVLAGRQSVPAASGMTFLLEGHVPAQLVVERRNRLAGRRDRPALGGGEEPAEVRVEPAVLLRQKLSGSGHAPILPPSGFASGRARAGENGPEVSSCEEPPHSFSHGRVAILLAAPERGSRRASLDAVVKPQTSEMRSASSARLRSFQAATDRPRRREAMVGVYFSATRFDRDDPGRADRKRGGAAG